MVSTAKGLGNEGVINQNKGPINKLNGLDNKGVINKMKGLGNEGVINQRNGLINKLNGLDTKDKRRGKRTPTPVVSEPRCLRCGGEDVEDGLPIMALFTPDPEVNFVKKEPQWVKLEAVVDSGAAESVATESMAPWVTKRESEGSRRGQTYLSASGDKLPNLGEKRFDIVTSEGNWAQATFQVAQVTRPLCSVSKMCDKGNRVVFELEGGYAQNIATGMKTKFARQNNVYVMDMYLEDGGREGAKDFGRQGA
jgi:hypothetical protein